MLSIRLQRVGKKSAPSYRVIVVPKHWDPWGKVTEILGHYNARREPRELVLNVERVKYWLSQGAEASDTIWNLLVDEKIVEGKKHSVTHISGARVKAMKEKDEARTQAEVQAKAKAAAAAQAAKEEEAKAKEEAKAAEEAAKEAQASKVSTPSEIPVEETPKAE
ncbi:TPA: 30S ribosomal protein S16 [Candidatus Uhrbacteria bacterium]|uniref:Small ribosomal subunit protein bS16 n=2 Tax=Candidatus Uhriibacteriota TaxID=1752732 RepID=A0A0G1Q6S7_9BACT|nr:MAG: Ribosomal protein S16 [Candidatus Uhrbacteria bacterium GW2011_GWF2_46_218]KKU40532.1 MAG: Ribosomal protein S16 [Candidatus Uhrbacteria bacterium GW2011_GWE2_46_68]HBK33623.1 30S ribosomal protein S16 [Candidatus Uhrbacteria bacterium]HCB19015.1 30S ribosomal protein S16 [Candidatus Uhrbacteria bacterium]